MGSFLILTLTLAANPINAQSLDYVGSALWSNPVDVIVDGNYAYCSYQAGLVILNISNPTIPRLASRLYVPGSQGRHLRKSGDYIYFIEEHEGLKIINVVNPTAPTIAGEYSESLISDIFIRDQYAYAIAGGSLRILDISAPAQPVLIGEHHRNGTYTSIWVSDDYAFVTAFADTMMIFNISDPTNPQIAARFGDFMNFYDDIWIRGNIAYLTVAFFISRKWNF